MKVGGIQHDIVWEDPVANILRLTPRVTEAAAGGAELVLLSEMFATGFSMKTERVAEPFDGPTVTFLVDQAARHRIWLGGSVAERPSSTTGDDRPSNCFVLAGPDGTVHRYRKIHPFSYGREHEQYGAGNEVVTVTIGDIRVTPFVCYDLRFADLFWGAAAGTDLYAVVANWPAARQAHWTTLLQARAIENQAYVIGVNRVGAGGGLDYAGGSLLVDPFGEVVAACAGEEELLFGDVDPDRVTDVRAKYPFLDDR